MPLISELQSVNNIGGVGLPDAPGGMLYSEQLTNWVDANASNGVEQYTDTQMYKEWRSPQDLRAIGIVLTPENFESQYRKEATRLRNMGFVQVDKPEIARIMLESYSRAAGSGKNFLPVTESSAKLLTDNAKHYEYQYISKVFEGVGNQVGSIAKKSGEVLEDLGEVVTNPFTIPTVAIIGVALAILAIKVK